MNTKCDETKIKSECGATPDEGQTATHSEIISALAMLPADALITEAGLAQIFDRKPISIKRAVARGELPAPTELLGAKRWTVAAILRHIEKRISQAAEAAELERKVAL